MLGAWLAHGMSMANACEEHGRSVAGAGQTHGKSMAEAVSYTHLRAHETS